MPIRKLNKSKKWRIWVMVILILFAIFYKYNNKLGQIRFWRDNLSWSNYTNVKGMVEKVDKMWYSEYFLKIDEEKIFLKNYPQNIGNLIWNNVLVRWEMKENNEGQIFFIKSLKDLDNNTLVEDNIYTFTDELLILNAKDTPWIVAYKQGDKIVIDYKNNHLIDISAFACSQISSSRDCKALINYFDLNENEYFNAYNWLVYYKINNNKRELFNDIFLWYYIDTKDDDILLNISSMIDVINSDYIFDNKKDFIIDNCEDLMMIDDVNIVWKTENFLVANIRWKTTHKKQVACEITFDLMNDWKVIENN